MMVLFALLGIGVVAVVAMLLARPRTLLVDDPVPGRPPVVPPRGGVTAQDLEVARFPVVLRGYRMADVDAYMAAAAEALARAEARAMVDPMPGLQVGQEPVGPPAQVAVVDGEPEIGPEASPDAGPDASAVAVAARDESQPRL